MSARRSRLPGAWGQRAQRSAGDWRGWAVALAAAILSWWALTATGEAVAAATAGIPPPDLQNPLRAEALLAQLPRWTAASVRAYLVFLAVDTVFPVAAALPLVLLLARALDWVGTGWAHRAQAAGVALAPLSLAVLDWVENGLFLGAVLARAGDPSGWVAAGVAVKSVKVALLSGTGPVLAVLAATGAARRLARSRVRASRH